MLARAVESAAISPDPLDYRTRLLLRDSLRALEKHWGSDRFNRWLRASARHADIELAIEPVFFDPEERCGFSTLERRVMDVVQPERIEALLRNVAKYISKPTRIVIGGSAALILAGRLSRATDDVDVVDEVPAELRDQHQVLDDLIDVYQLRLAHFQSHYLPSGWENRIHSIGIWGNLTAFAVDAIDIFVGKLFSVRKKDRSDLVVLLKVLDRDVIRHRARESTTVLRSDPRLLDAAQENWFILFGEQLPDLSA
jgi:hypothetical protein